MQQEEETTSIERALRQLQKSTSERFWKFWLLRDCERLLPDAKLIDELRAAGLSEVVDAFGAIALKLVALRCALLREEN